MPRHNKYNVSPPAERTWKLRTYASKAEMEYARLLNAIMVLEKNIAFIREQPRIELGLPENIYVPDFAVWYVGEDKPMFIDVKGMETPAFRRAKKLWAKYGPGRLRIIKRRGKKFVCTEEIGANQ